MSLFIRIFCESRDPAEAEQRVLALYYHPNTPEHEKKAASEAYKRLTGNHPPAVPKRPPPAAPKRPSPADWHVGSFDWMGDLLKDLHDLRKPQAARDAAIKRHPPGSPEREEAERNRFNY